MLTAGRSFNHYIQTTKAESHKLVTTGVYAWSRHPAYVGWFYWSLGTQVGHQVVLDTTINLSAIIILLTHTTVTYSVVRT